MERITRKQESRSKQLKELVDGKTLGITPKPVSKSAPRYVSEMKVRLKSEASSEEGRESEVNTSSIDERSSGMPPLSPIFSFKKDLKDKKEGASTSATEQNESATPLERSSLKDRLLSSPKFLKFKPLSPEERRRKSEVKRDSHARSQSAPRCNIIGRCLESHFFRNPSRFFRGSR